MKLRNKETGDIGEFNYFPNPENNLCYFIVETEYMKFTYYSFNKLKEEWEDYEEPKDFYIIENWGNVGCRERIDDDYELDLKLIGNYFETKEEAEKAVEKLKAWKRLKDAGFKFRGWEGNIEEHNYAIIHCFMPSLTRNKGIWEPIDFEDIKDALNLLFGGED